ncbi:hypothetical protein C0989_007846, partial [Termitomyces sp. Mn162]
FSNYTLKYVDASFYQVARGLVLPFTIVTSYFAFRSIPSLRILVACGVVTIGFFIGVFLDGTKVSMLGVFFGVVSSGITALHSVVIKESLKGALGFLMSIASLLSIKVTSPITHMVSSAVRGVAASLLGMWLFHDIITRYVLIVLQPVYNPSVYL